MATPRPSDSFIARFSDLALASPDRSLDLVLRALDVAFSALFLLVALPIAAPIALVILLTDGPPLFFE